MIPDEHAKVRLSDGRTILAQVKNGTVTVPHNTEHVEFAASATGARVVKVGAQPAAHQLQVMEDLKNQGRSETGRIISPMAHSGPSYRMGRSLSAMAAIAALQQALANDMHEARIIGPQDLPSPVPVPALAPEVKLSARQERKARKAKNRALKSHGF